VNEPGTGPAHSIGSVPPLRVFPWWLMLTLVGIYLLLALTPLVSVGNPLVNSVLATLLFVALSVALVLQMARPGLTPLWELYFAVVSAGAWYAALWAAGQGDLLRLYLQPVASLCFVLACVFLGRLLSRILRDPNILLPVAVVAILADLFTVTVGPTGKALEVAPELVEKFSVGLPQAGSAAGPEGAAGLTMLATMGVGDFVFLALFLTAAARFSFSLPRGAKLIIALVCAALVIYFALPFVGLALPGIPLLPFIAGGFLIAYWGHFRLTPTETKALLWGALLLAAILAGLAWVMRG